METDCQVHLLPETKRKEENEKEEEEENSRAQLHFGVSNPTVMSPSLVLGSHFLPSLSLCDVPLSTASMNSCTVFKNVAGSSRVGPSALGEEWDRREEREARVGDSRRWVTEGEYSSERSQGIVCARRGRREGKCEQGRKQREQEAR